MQNATTATRFDLRFAIEPRDYYALLRLKKHTAAERFLSVLIPSGYWGIALLITIFYMAWQTPGGDFLDRHLGDFAAPFVVLVLGGTFFVFHRLVIFPKVLRDSLQGQSIGRGENVLTADDHEVAMRAGAINITTPWSGIERVADSPACIILFTGRSSGLLVPRRAFENTSEADRFLAFAKSKVERS